MTITYSCEHTLSHTIGRGQVAANFRHLRRSFCPDCDRRFGQHTSPTARRR